jgi:hypothetical protein
VSTVISCPSKKPPKIESLRLKGLCIQFCTLLLLAFCLQSYAIEDSVGSLVRVSGAANIIGADGETRSAKDRERIFPGDTLVTTDTATVTANFFDLTRVVLRQSTALVINRFPITMDDGDIEMELLSGGVHITSGTIAAQSPDRFTLLTPSGSMQVGRAEWLVRVCTDGDCAQQQELQQCNAYVQPETISKSFIAVYDGEVSIDFCAIPQSLDAGNTLVIPQLGGACEILAEIPCFILLDDRRDRSNIRLYSDLLTPIDDREIRPNMRPDRPPPRSGRPPPRVNRPPRGNPR